MQRAPDPYRVLGVSREATTVEVKAAHRRLAKRYHPDAPQADAARFLAVQDAYELLRDTLRRRDWDRKHMPGPVRAETPAATPGRRRATGAAQTVGPEAQAASTASQRRARPAGVDATFGPNDRPPTTDHWTWTADGVPWWEDGGSPKTRRTSRRSSAGDGGAKAETTARAAAHGQAATAPGPTVPSEPAAGEAPNQFDAFSRSSGAAWSSASRAYFRRRGAEMPSGAANPNTPRWTTPVGAPPPRRYASPPTAGAPPRPAVSPAAGAPARATRHVAHPAAPSSSSSRSLGSALAALFRRGDR